VRFLLVMTAAAMLVGDATDADACICPSKAFALPAVDATDVPTNVRELYFPAMTMPYWTGSPALRAASGEEVAITVRATPGYHDRMYTAELLQELQPDTHYTLWVETDEKALAFTTGAGPDLVAPPAPHFDGLRIDYFNNADDSSSCGKKSFAIEGYVVAPLEDDIETVVLRFVASDGSSQERILPLSPTGTRGADEHIWFPNALGPRVCQLDLKIVEGEYGVEAWTIDAAGNTSEVATQRVTVDGGCSTTRSGSFASVLVVLAFVTRRRRRE
jgi:hypothetical protein